MKIMDLFIGTLLIVAVAIANAEVISPSENNFNSPATGNDSSSHGISNSQSEHSPKTAPLQPYPRLLALKLNAPTSAQVDVPFDDININLDNVGDAAPNARLRIIIHAKNYHSDTDQAELNPSTVKVEVQEGEVWKPIVLGMVENGVMGAIGAEGAAEHRERHKRGGFAIPPKSNQAWRLRMTFSVPGTYSVVAAVSPDNGSRHIAQPAFTTIVVQ